MAAPTEVEIRRYVDLEEFRADAASMAAAGWMVVAQTETTDGVNPVWVGAAIITGFIGLLFFWPVLLLLIVVLVAGNATRGKQLVVTYRLNHAGS